MKINNNINLSQNNNATFKGCDISKISKAIIQEHVEWHNLIMSEHNLEEALTNAQVEQRAENIWQKILGVYNHFKDDSKIRIEISDAIVPFVGKRIDGQIQAKIGFEGDEFYTSAERVVSNTDEKFDLVDKILREASGYLSYEERIERGLIKR